MGSNSDLDYTCVKIRRNSTEVNRVTWLEARSESGLLSFVTLLSDWTASVLHTLPIR